MKFKYNGYVVMSDNEDDEDIICLAENLQKYCTNKELASSIANDLIANDLVKNDVSDEEYELGTIFNKVVPNVSITIYASDKTVSYEEAVKNQILMSIGELSISESWVGYSEYTILGYSLDEFKLIGNGGEHDLIQILKGYEGKYIWFVLEI